MTVDDVFSIRGRGTVTTGRIEQGSLRVGDQVRINDGDPRRVDGIEAFRKLLDEAQAGQNVGLLFRGLELGQVDQGDVITGADDPAEEAPVTPAGAPEAPIAPPAPVTPAETSGGRDPRFAEAESQRQQFLSMRQAGLMGDAQIDDALAAIAFTVGGRSWKLTAATDHWFSSEGGKWKHDSPPG